MNFLSIEIVLANIRKERQTKIDVGQTISYPMIRIIQQDKFHKKKTTKQRIIIVNMNKFV